MITDQSAFFAERTEIFGEVAVVILNHWRNLNVGSRGKFIMQAHDEQWNYWLDVVQWIANAALGLSLETTSLKIFE